MLKNRRGSLTGMGTVVLSFLALVIVPSAWAGITIKGTDAEKKQIQDAIDKMKNTSPKAKELFNELAGRPENVVIRFGKTSDLATASTDEVILNKTAIDCMKQINKPGGGGKALEASSLGHIIAHEALGHVLNGLKGKDNGEAAATAVENMIRAQQGLPKQTKLSERVGEKDTIPFSDGSKVDVTDALRKAAATEGGKGKPRLRIEENAFVKLAAGLNDQGLIDVTTDPLAGPQQLSLDLAEFGEGVALVDLLSFNAQMAPTAESEDFNLEVSNFSMAFDSFSLNGQPTGPNYFNMITPNRTSIGNWDFDGAGKDFAFAFSGDVLWTNDIFQGLNDDGYLLQSFNGSMLAAGSREWTGSAAIEGGMYAPVPEPATLLLFGLGMMGLGWFRRPRE